MKFLFVGYTANKQFHHPQDWLFRIRAYLGVLESLAKQHEVVSIEQINYTGLIEQNGVQYHFIQPLGRRNYFPRKLHRFIAAQSPDIILIHGMEHPLQLLHLRSVIGSQPKIIVQSHSPRLPSGIKYFVQKIAGRSINAYFFSSKLMAAPWLQKKLISHAGKLFEVPVGSSVFQRIDKATARKNTGATGAQVFVWAGRLDNNKDPLTAVIAFLELIKSEPCAKLYMIFQQDDLLPQVQHLLQTNEQRNAVTLVGAVSHNDMQDWFNSADFIISTSHFEVFGAAVAEAMSCGCIPLLSDIPAYRSITGNGSCGALFEAGDPDSLLRVLQQWVKMDLAPEETKTLALFDNQLSFDAIAQKVARIAASL